MNPASSEATEPEPVAPAGSPPPAGSATRGLRKSPPRAGSVPPVPGEPAPAEPLPHGLAAVLVFIASGAILVLETASLRLVGPYLGVTLQVTSSVIGVALAALAYGAWLGGWLADRRDPRPLLAPAYILAGIATAATLPIVRYAGELLRGGAVAAILLLTSLAVFVPAVLLAAVTPLLVKLQLGDLRRTGQVVGKLSSLGTLGGITATLGTGFVLVAALSTTAILMSLAVLLGLTGVALLAYLRRRSRTELPGWPGIRAAAAVVGLAGATLSAMAPTPCDVETAYHCARVDPDPDRSSGRTLVLNSAKHSYVDLADPRHLEFAYTQWFGAVADVQAPPGQRLDALHLGGGGFTMPRYLSATRPGTRNTVFEIDGGLVDLDRRALGVETGPDLTVAVGDARVLLGRRPAGSADLVVGDAFGHLVVPWHLATREMAAEIRRVLRPDGVYVQNVIDYPPARFVRAEIATVAAEFPHVALVAPPAAVAGREAANFVLVASMVPLPLAELRDRLAAPTIEPVSVLTGDELRTFVGRSRVLTDDYAPVDQLLAGT